MKRVVCALVSVMLVLVVFSAVNMLAAEPCDYLLKIGLDNPPDTLDVWTWSAGGRAITYAAHESLVTYQRGSLEPVPGLAKSWTISEDATIYTFFLREGVRFTDGSAFNANAVQFNFDRMNKLNLGPAQFIEDVIAVEAVDEYTVRMYLEHASSSFLNRLYTIRIVNPLAVSDHSSAEDPLAKEWFYNHSAGTGPYIVSEWRADEYIKLVWNKDYWAGWSDDNVREITALIIPETSTQRLMLQKGDLDIAGKMSVDDARILEEQPNLVVKEESSPVTFFFHFNVSRAPTSDLLV